MTHSLKAQSGQTEDGTSRIRSVGKTRAEPDTTPNPAVNARVEDSRAKDWESLSFAGSEALLTRHCLGVHH